jgi:hypothetical protein
LLASSDVTFAARRQIMFEKILAPLDGSAIAQGILPRVKTPKVRSSPRSLQSPGNRDNM